MIAAFAARLLTPLGAALAAGVAGIAITAAVWLHGDHTGYQRARAHYEAEAARQVAAQQEATRKALQSAYRRVAEINRRNAGLNEQLRSIEHEAAADSGADNLAIGADSVQRLNSIR